MGRKDWNQTIQEAHDNYTVRVDEASATVIYIGKAPVSTSTSSSQWQIRKIDTSSGVVITWADGNDYFDNVWDNRSGLTYS